MSANSCHAPVAVPDNLDIWQSTNLLVQQHGDDAALLVTERTCAQREFFFPLPSVASFMGARRAYSRAIKAW